MGTHLVSLVREREDALFDRVGVPLLEPRLMVSSYEASQPTVEFLDAGEGDGPNFVPRVHLLSL